MAAPESITAASPVRRFLLAEIHMDITFNGGTGEWEATTVMFTYDQAAGVAPQLNDPASSSLIFIDAQQALDTAGYDAVEVEATYMADYQTAKALASPTATLVSVGNGSTGFPGQFLVSLVIFEYDGGAPDAVQLAIADPGAGETLSATIRVWGRFTPVPPV